MPMVLERDVQQSHMGVIRVSTYFWSCGTVYSKKKFELYFVQNKVNKLSDFIEIVNIIGSSVGFRF